MLNKMTKMRESEMKTTNLRVSRPGLGLSLLTLVFGALAAPSLTSASEGHFDVLIYQDGSGNARVGAIDVDDTLPELDEVVLEGDGAVTPVRFKSDRAEEGRFVYVVRVNAPAEDGEKEDNHKSALVNRGHFQFHCFQRQDATFIIDDVLQERDLQTQARFLLDLLDLTELQDQRLLTFINDEDRGQAYDGEQRNSADQNRDLAHQLLPLRSSFSGR